VTAGYNVHIHDIVARVLDDAVLYVEAHKEGFSLMPRISKEKENIGGVETEGETQRETQTAITKIDLESYSHLLHSALVRHLPSLNRRCVMFGSLW
jgi:hypothetical protein